MKEKGKLNIANQQPKERKKVSKKRVILSILLLTASISLIKMAVGSVKDDSSTMESNDVPAQLELKEVASTNKQIHEIPNTNTFILTDGHYTAGIDIPTGTINLKVLKGDGNVKSSNIFDGGINAMMGVDEKNTGLYVNEFKGLVLNSGDVLSISGGLDLELDYLDVKSQETGRVYDEKKSFELSDGNYTTGIDIKAGTYKVIALKGNGNISSSNIFENGINEMFGVDEKETGFYTKEFYNLELKENDTLKISGNITIQFIPVK